MKNFFICILILAGFVMGVLLGDLCSQVEWLKFLNFGFNFGFENPIILNLGVLKLTLGFWMKVNLGGLVGLVATTLIANKVMKK